VKRHAYLLLISSWLLSCSNNKSHSSLDDAGQLLVLPIFQDAIHDELTMKKWPLEGDQIQQSIQAVDGRGQVWDIQTKAGGNTVAHAQFNAGSRSLAAYADGTLKFDLRVLETGGNGESLVVKLSGVYPQRAEYPLTFSTQGTSASSPECESRKAAIENAQKAGELEILKQSSDPFMATCIEALLSGWREYSVALKDLQPLEGFSMGSVIDPFVLEIKGAAHVQLDNVRIEAMARSQPSAPQTPVTPTTPAGPVNPAAGITSYSDIGPNVTGSMVNNVAVTEGIVRVRRRHENDMDFAKFNPFYWEGRLTNFKVEDFTPNGENRIKFTLKTEWPQDYTPNRGPDFSAIYTGDPKAGSETLRSKFAINQRMSHIANQRHFEATIGPEVFNAYPDQLKKGALLVFEFRFFNDESFPGWQKQKAFNPHNLSAYYSEFFRIRIGEAGLHIENLDSSSALPAPARYSGGWTTIPTVRVEPWKALQQQANNLTFANAQNFLMGRTWFHTDFVSGQHIGDISDDKPSTFFEEMRAQRSGYAASAFNVKSCNACHIHNGISLLPDEANLNQPVHALVVKTMNKNTGNAHAQFGQQLQTSGQNAEGTLKVERFEKKTVQLDDGTVVTLRKPIFKVENALYATDDLGLSPRKPQALIGMGLLEAVPDSVLRELANQNKGEARMVNGRVGRFGWKANHPAVKDQIIGALNNDMGVTSQTAPNVDCTNCQPGKAALPNKAIDDIDSYVSLLGVPPRTNPTDATVQRGEKIFEQLGCQNCHVKSLRTGTSKFPELSGQTIQAFTDLLLHDMGEGLADASQGPYARKWRTAPLWGLKNVKHSTNAHLGLYPPGQQTIVFTDTQRTANANPIQLLHDGRAQSIPEAILWHGGQAEASVNLYKKLPKADRDALEAFLWDL
jgi:CxxC motif-containing protein (DUF1111 family)